MWLLSPRPALAFSALILLSMVLSAATSTAGDSGGALPKLSACQNLDCLESRLTREAAKKYTQADCAPLDGKPGKDGQSLGFFCRLRLARKQAETRKTAPCTSDEKSAQKDWDAGLEQNFLRLLYSRALFERLPANPLARLPESYGVFNGPVHGTSVFERQFRFKQENGEASEAAYKTYFCLTDSPRRYVPYFHGLSIDGRVITHAAVAEPPYAHEPVIAQLAFGFGPEYVRVFELSDLDASGVKDVLVLSDHSTEGFRVSACLHAAKGKACREIRASAPFAPPRASSGRLNVVGPGVVHLELFDDEGKPLGHARFEVENDRYVLRETQGGS